MKQYDIRTVVDFADIPHDRIDACLADFRECIKLFRGVKADAAANGYADRLQGMGFVWTDDGQVGLTGMVVKHVAADGETESSDCPVCKAGLLSSLHQCLDENGDITEKWCVECGYQWSKTKSEGAK